MREWKLENIGKLRPEDRCGLLRLAASCDDMLVSVRSVLELAGR